MINIAMQYLNANAAVKKNLIDYYNENCVQLVSAKRRFYMTPTENWCAMFCSVIAHKAGLKAFPYEVSVQEMRNLAIDSKTYVKGLNGVDVNDLLLYDWNGDNWLDHVGIVKAVYADKIEVIEGNYKGTVAIRTITPRSTRAIGYIKTEYVEYAPSIEQLVQDTLRGKYGNGKARENALGSNFALVQKIINDRMKKAH